MPESHPSTIRVKIVPKNAAINLSFPPGENKFGTSVERAKPIWVGDANPVCVTNTAPVSRDVVIKGMSGLSFEIPTGSALIAEKGHHTDMNRYITKTENGLLNAAKALGVISLSAQSGR